jgi:hypothetical protein
MKAICVASSNRLKYIEWFIRHLDENDTSGWMLFVREEPNETANQARALWRDVSIEAGLTRNDRVMGPDANVYRVCEDAMNLPHCEALLSIDDDVLLSPDALTLCDWYLKNLPSGKQAGLCLCNEASDPERPWSISALDTWRGLVGQGHFYTRRQWEEFIAPNFWNVLPGKGYDWSLTVRALEQGYTILRPRLSRSQHIGLEGFHGAAGGAHLEVFPRIVAIKSYGGGNYTIE